ncbi:sensor histidine kinase [Nitrospira sp. Nam74]
MFHDDQGSAKPVEARSEPTQDALRQLLDATGVVPWEANAQTWQFTYVGQQAVKLLGYPVERWYEKGFWADHILIEDRARSIEYCLEHSQTDDQYQFEYRMHRADDQIVWIQDIVTVVRDNGAPALLQGFLIDVTARKQADEALRKSEERFLLAVQGSNTGLWDWDIHANQVFLSPIWKRMLGYEDFEIKDSFEEWEGRLHPDERERVVAILRDHLAGSLSEYELEHRLRHKNGSYRWVLSRGVSLRDANGKPTRFAGSHVDITKLKETREALEASEQALRERNTLFGKLAERIDQVFWFMELNPQRVVYVSPAFGRIWGVPVETAYADPRTWLKSIHPEDQRPVSAAFDAYIRGEAPTFHLEYRILRPDGTVRWICDEGARIMGESGRVRWVSGIAKDITERKLAEDALRESEERFRLMADSAPVMIWMSDIDKRCSYFNKRWLDFTGRPVEKELGDGWAENVHPHDVERCVQKYSNAFDAKRQFVMEYRLRRFDGEYRWIIDFGTPRFESSGGFCGYIGSCIDITDRKFVQDALRKSEAKFRALFESNVLPIIYWEDGGAVVDANDAYLQLTGFTKAELKAGKVRWDVFIPPDHAGMKPSSLAKMFLGQPEFRVAEKVYQLRDGRRIPALVTGALLPGKRDRGIAFVVDLTERKMAEKTLSELSGRMISAQEDERTAIARELHDDIGQRMALLAIQVEKLSKLVSRGSQESGRLVECLRNQTKEIASDIQHISHDLHSAKLEHLGLIFAVKALCRDVSAHKHIRIDLTAPSVSTAIPQTVGLCLYRVVQEALQNVVKHSGSGEARVNISVYQDAIDLSISDSGIGFDCESAVAEGRVGLGLVSMRERVRLVRGEFVIDSHPSQGTTIRVRVPLNRGR